jgi:hypothetical protein
LLSSSHLPRRPIHPDGAYVLSEDQLLVLSLSAIVRMHPDGIVTGDPGNDLSILDGDDSLEFSDL